MKIRTHTGSEWHTSYGGKGYIFLVKDEVDGKVEVPLYSEYEAEDSEWNEVGHHGKHGKWVTARYDVPEETILKIFGMRSWRGRPEEISVAYIILDPQAPLRRFEGAGYDSEGYVWLEGNFRHIPKDELEQYRIETEKKYMRYVDKNFELKEG